MDRRGTRRDETQRPQQQPRTVGRSYAEVMRREDTLQMLEGEGRGIETIEKR